MTITTTECEQILKWHDIIKSCKEHCETTWNPQQMTRYCNEAESAFHMFAASYAKHLLKPGFPRGHGWFWIDMDTVVEEIDKFLKAVTVVPASQAQSKSRKPHRPRRLTNKEIAEKFDAQSLDLLRAKTKDGELIYERDNKGNICKVGTCAERTLKSWLTKYPDRSKTEKHSGFHAGMLTNEEEIDSAVKGWQDYCKGYAMAFYKWRQTHQDRPKSDFRYKTKTIVPSENMDRFPDSSNQNQFVGT